ANLRRFLKNETAIDRFVDFGDLQIFEDATNYPCIVVARNTKPALDHKVQFAEVESLPRLETENLLEKASHVKVAQNSLGEDSWNFDRPEVEALRRKIFSKGRPLKDVAGSPLYGIKTGLNEAFVIDKATRDRLVKEEFGQRSKQPHPDPLLEGEGEFPSSCGKDAVSANNSPSTYGRNAFSPNCSPSPFGEEKDGSSCSSYSTSPFGRGEGEGVFGDGLSPTNHPLIKPFLVGRDLKQWHYDFRERYLIFTRHGTDIEKYPTIKKYLEQFREKLEPKPLDWPKNKTWQGRKPGSYKWFEIQDNIAYYKAFEGPKIVYPDLARIPKFSFDMNGNYLANTGYICNGSFWLIGALNSRINWFEIQCTANSMRGGLWRYRLIYQTMEILPIIDPPGDENNPSTPKGRLALLAKKAQEKAFKRLQLRHDLLEMIGDQLGQGKANEGDDAEEVSEGSDINKWDTLSWNDFVKKAQSPSAFGKAFKEQFAPMTRRLLDLKRLFEEMQPECKQLTEEIHACENEINQIVYGLYELTPDEIKLLEELTGNIYED
ncbi:MAG TPA: TaqI-like C-terminal specificity domain-containing protein, partial [Caldisericia bacterium]|nr:TaqI-like C-terminal specificity domain-containing protein [Caldisericia bacterium]